MRLSHRVHQNKTCHKSNLSFALSSGRLFFFFVGGGSEGLMFRPLRVKERRLKVSGINTVLKHQF